MRQHYATSDSLQELSFASHVLDVSGFNPTPQADLDESLPGPLWKLYCATCDWDVRWSRERGGGSETAAPWTRKLMEFCISPGASPTHAIHVGTYFASAQEEKGSMKRGEAPACHGLAEASVTWLFLCRGCLLEGKYASDIRRNSLLTPHSITCQLPLDPASSPIFFSWPDLNTRAGSAFRACWTWALSHACPWLWALWGSPDPNSMVRSPALWVLPEQKMRLAGWTAR